MFKSGVGTIKICEICGEEFKRNSNRQKYCAKCRAMVRKLQVKNYVQIYIEKIGKDDWNKKSRDGMRRYREHWGFNNKNEQLGSGRLSPKPNPDFEVELKIIQWEKRRLGIKEYEVMSK